MPEFLDAREATEREHETMAREMAGQLRVAGLTAEAELRTGDAASQIVAAAQAWDADLIVMGTHGHTGLERILLGSVARNVLQHAPSSILIARDLACGHGQAEAAVRGSARYGNDSVTIPALASGRSGTWRPAPARRTIPGS
jgi:hypothetical protein